MLAVANCFSLKGAITDEFYTNEARDHVMGVVSAGNVSRKDLTSDTRELRVGLRKLIFWSQPAVTL